MSRLIRYKRPTAVIGLLGILVLSAIIVHSQTPTAFTYQGRLTDAGAPANGNYDLQFTLWDAASGGTQQPAGAPVTVTRTGVAVANGIFTTQLDFGASAFPGASRWLGIGARLNGTPTFTTLSPRQPITPTPYAIRSLTASSADAVTVSGVPGGSGNYVQNTTSQQTASNFNISGNGTAGGTLSGGTVNATTQYNLGGSRLISASGTNNLFIGNAAAAAGLTGLDNTYVGANAGNASTTGDANSFFGVSAGFNNRGTANSFFGRSAGFQNTTGENNSFFGVQAGRDNSTGSRNSFFGWQAGIGTQGFSNSFFGAQAGAINQGSFNNFFGDSAGFSNTTGSDNSFFGDRAGSNNTTGINNNFFGSSAGRSNTTGSHNNFFGDHAGLRNTTGGDNNFFGSSAGLSNTTGERNSFFGNLAGESNTTGSVNSFFGAEAGKSNTNGGFNNFFGNSAGKSNTTGGDNSFFGNQAGLNNTTGGGNAFFGTNAGDNNTTGINNTAIGSGADVSSGNLTNATAIGAGTIVTAGNRVQIGRKGVFGGFAGDTVAIGGFAAPASSTPVCINGDGVFTSCAASSLRFKENVRPSSYGLNLIQRLRPVIFSWKEDHQPDLGLVAEEVATIEPSLTTRNRNGEIEGVKYTQLTVVLINAIKEQQAQIETLRISNAKLQARLRALERRTVRSQRR